MRAITMARSLLVGLVGATLIAFARPAVAQPKADEWQKRYDEARTDMIDGHFRAAEASFRALAAQGRTEAERALATEMARLSATYAERDRRAPPAPPIAAPEARTSDEITLLYASAFLYGAGTGAWFLLQTEPDTALTATLPFAALTALPVVAVFTADSVKKFPRGVPHAISAGLYLGLAQGIWLVGYQNSRGARIAKEDPRSSVRWAPESNATVLWGSATIGAALGGILGSALETTPGRVSFAASTTMWAGAITGLGAGAVLPDDEHRRERAFLAGGMGLNAGLAGGLFFAGAISPSVARVRLVDLLGIAGGLATAGFYLSIASPVDVRLAEGLTALGAGAGLATGWIVTSGMPKDVPSKRSASTIVQPSLRAAPGGGTLGVSGVF
jgi:hypothetical protein